MPEDDKKIMELDSEELDEVAGGYFTIRPTSEKEQDNVQFSSGSSAHYDNLGLGPTLDPSACR